MLCNKKNKRIRALHANKDGHSYIWVTFRELHSEKITFRVQYAQNLYKIQKTYIINIKKNYSKVYKNMLKEISEKYEENEDFINNRIDEVLSQKNCLLRR